MKSIELKTKEIAAAYGIINAAKYQKLSDDDKVKVWKISRKLSPIAEQYEKDIEDARQKLTPSEDFSQKLQKAIHYQNLKEDDDKESLMSEEEYRKIVVEWNNYNSLLDKALKELAEKKIAIEVDAITEEAFGKLMSSNDWSFEQVGKLEFMIG